MTDALYDGTFLGIFFRQRFHRGRRIPATQVANARRSFLTLGLGLVQQRDVATVLDRRLHRHRRYTPPAIVVDGYRVQLDAPGVVLAGGFPAFVVVAVAVLSRLVPHGRIA